MVKVKNQKQNPQSIEAYFITRARFSSCEHLRSFNASLLVISTAIYAHFEFRLNDNRDYVVYFYSSSSTIGFVDDRGNKKNLTGDNEH